MQAEGVGLVPGEGASVDQALHPEEDASRQQEDDQQPQQLAPRPTLFGGQQRRKEDGHPHRLVTENRRAVTAHPPGEPAFPAGPQVPAHEKQAREHEPHPEHQGDRGDPVDRPEVAGVGQEQQGGEERQRRRRTPLVHEVEQEQGVEEMARGVDEVVGSRSGAEQRERQPGVDTDADPARPGLLHLRRSQVAQVRPGPAGVVEVVLVVEGETVVAGVAEEEPANCGQGDERGGQMQGFQGLVLVSGQRTKPARSGRGPNRASELHPFTAPVKEPDDADPPRPRRLFLLDHVYPWR